MERTDKFDMLRLSNEESNKITRESLMEALLQLMKEKDYEKITVTELVKRAGVSRMSFYRNYGKIGDILDDIRNYVIAEIKKYLSDAIGYDGTFGIYREMLNEIKKNAETLGLLLKAKTHISAIFRDSLVLENTSEDGSAEYYTNVAKEGAITSVIGRWFFNGMKESVDFVADYCAKISVISN